MIDIKIGIIQHPHEIDIEIDSKAEDVIKAIDEAIAAEKPLVWLIDSKGNQYGVPVAKVAFVEVRSSDDVKRVGFGV